MKTIIFLTLFVTIKSLSIKDFRKQFAPKFDELINIIAECRNIEEISRKIDEKYYDTGDHTLSSITVQDYMIIFNNRIRRLNEIFITAISEYLDESLLLYYQTAYKLVMVVLKTNHTLEDEQNVSSDIDMGDDNFCVTTFIDIVGNISYTNYDNIFLLKSIVRRRFKLKDLSNRIWQVLMNLKYQYKNTMSVVGTNKLYITEGPKDIKNLTFELKNQKEKIKNFSKLFCLSTIPPYVDTVHFFEEESHENRNEFIDFMYRKEMCQVTVSNSSYNMLYTE